MEASSLLIALYAVPYDADDYAFDGKFIIGSYQDRLHRGIRRMQFDSISFS